MLTQENNERIIRNSKGTIYVNETLQPNQNAGINHRISSHN